jgi:hypothetical protein
MAALLAVSSLHAATTFTYRNGANGYAGAADFSINTQYADSNGGNGVRWTGTPQLGVYSTTDAPSYSARYLLKFANLSIPAGQQIVSATLSLSVEYWGNGTGNLTGLYLKNAWDPTANNMGWLHRDGSNDWAGPGASSAGVDTVAGKSFQFPALKAIGNQTLTIPLDAAVVQSWIDSPAANQGIMLVNNIPGDIVNINSTAAAQNIRPMLTVVIAGSPAVSIGLSPQTVSVKPGAKQTFTASVMGTSNVAVNWAATGGTITSAGVYTAGTTEGSFTVTATSVADPTKSATSQVAVQSVKISVAPSPVTLLFGQTQQFTATVTGNSNTNVTWSATGGTISSTGLFTAGTKAGSFTVTAKSAADTTKTASATVTVNAAPVVSVTVAPPTATLQVGQTQQFTATVTGNANTAVTWSATGGTISTTGLFTAGNTAGSFSVTATSAADTTKSAKATVTVNAAPVVTVAVSPTNAVVQTGKTQQFTATVTGNSNTAVTWTATGGTISNTGLFTAGATAGSFSVTATSVADPTKSGSTPVSVQAQAPVSVSVNPPTATLQFGQTQQFTATVTGSSNTNVTWTATGGSISISGLFTAGATSGAFTVTATSVADPTKLGTAQVTVQPPQPVSVTVSPLSISLLKGQSQTFTATVTGSSNTGVNWNATGGTITSAGVFTAGQTTGNFTVTATSLADTSKTGTASVTINNGTNLPPVPRQNDGPYVVVQSPVTGMHFFAPAMIRIYADPSDIEAPDQDALTVNFFINGQQVGTFTNTAATNGYYPLTVNNVAAGTYTITAQFVATGNRLVTSAPVTVFVDNPPASTGQVFNLTADTVLSGSTSTVFAGTAGNPCTINGNGFQIRSASGFSGSLTISNCNIRGLGTATKSAIDVTVGGTGAINITGNIWEMFGTVSVAANDQAQAVIRNNEFRENVLVPVGALPWDDSIQSTAPVFMATGNSSAQKFFQGNNVGMSTVAFLNTRNWLIGGNTDAESNVMIGVRCGFSVFDSTGMVLRGNYSQHNYPHRFSQGQNFEFSGDGYLAEHNVIRSSSWPVRGFGGELRYNIIDGAGNSDEVFQAPQSNANIHHNIFTFAVSQTLYSPGSGLQLPYSGVDNVQFHNNVMDGGGVQQAFYGPAISVLKGAFIGSLRNNMFYNFAGLSDGPMVTGDLFEATNPLLPRLRYADYNGFFNPAATNQTNYGLSVVGLTAGAAGYGGHDLGGFNGHVNPKFTAPTQIPFPFAPEDIWSRTKKVSDVLSAFRTMYSPAPGSPLIGAGDPQDGVGGNIGAIGNGEPADQFGKFGGGSSTPSSPVIGSFTALPSPVQAGTSVTLSWSVSGATSLSIAPGIGTVTGNSIVVTPSATTTYTLTATNAGGTASATATATVQAGPVVNVTVSPNPASLTAGQSQQFTATVTGSSNTAVTWSATGGTINAAGLFTAGATAGSFSVKATSVADTTRSGTATVTVTPVQPITIALNPPSTTLFPGGTQQFTATVTGTSNTAVNFTATGGSITSAGLFTAGTATGAFTVTATSVQDPTKSASSTVTVITQTSSGHPRMVLDAPTLATLRSRMQAKTPEWIALQNVCNSFIGGGVVNPPGSNEYPDKPSIGEGYQGSGYLESFMPLAMCYQVVKDSDPTKAAQYGAKGVAILMAMSDPAHFIIDGQPIWDRDAGYGIRNSGFVLGIGYDWLHDLLSPAQQTQVQTALKNWIEGFENDSFEFEHPQGNYFAGYYVSKCFAGLAVEGDSPLGTTWFNDWYNNQHLQRVQPYYLANYGGGGWTEGFMQYGILASINQTMPVLAMKTAKGIDLLHGDHPYAFPLDQGKWLMAFTWPTKDLVDDRGELYETNDPVVWPSTPRLQIYKFFAGFLAMNNDPAAPMMHKYTRDVQAKLATMQADDSVEWTDFLFWDETAPEADYSTMPLSYLAPGEGGVAARANWTTDSSMMSFMSAPYINFPAAGHEAFDKGQLAIERNKNPLLPNPPAWFAHTPNGNAGWSATFDDRFGNFDVDKTVGNRIIYNTFQVRRLDAGGKATDNYGQEALTRDDGPRTKIGRFEDGGSYVLAVGQFLEDMYRPFNTVCAGKSPVTEWSRQILFLRPTQFVVYDRTGVCTTGLDQYLAFHFAANPLEVFGQAQGVRRFDVNDGQFAGSMMTVLPAGTQINVTDRFWPSDPNTFNKMWRQEIRPAGTAPATTQRWLNVFDTASSPALVAATSNLTVTSGAAVGVVLQSASGNTVAVFGTAPVGTSIAGGLSYQAPAMQARHIITDLPASGSYTATATVSGSNVTVTITPGGSLKATANGVLTFNVTAGGVVQP